MLTYKQWLAIGQIIIAQFILETILDVNDYSAFSQNK